MFNPVCVCGGGGPTSGLRVALEQAGQMGPWREKAMGKRLVLFWQAWSSHTNQPCEGPIRTIRSPHQTSHLMGENAIHIYNVCRTNISRTLQAASETHSQKLRLHLL